MTMTEKYGFKVSKDQFGANVSEDFFDRGEAKFIAFFEETTLKLLDTPKDLYSMVELGSNQAYYSLLFKHIIGKNKSINILVEPKPVHLERGKGEFALNECEGVFYERKVGKTWGMRKEELEVSAITLTDILKENKLDELDMLHCDIDSSEYEMLKENEDVFKEGKVRYAFIFIHTPELYNQCTEFFNKVGYKQIFEWRLGNNKGATPTDDLIVYERQILQSSGIHQS